MMIIKMISFNASLLLERAFPHKGIEISMLHMFDNQRHLGMDNDTGVPHFNLSGSVTLGLYYAKVNFGTPAKAFHVQVDTGSDLFWVSCSTCKNCPKYSQLGIVKFFTPESSLTASSIGCYQSFCPHKHLGIKTSCLKGNLCGYTSSYADTIDTLGYFVSDLMRFDITYENDTTATFSTNIIFGCTTSLTGFPTSRGPADGIIGLGHSEVSILSQLASHEEVPKIFSHCLMGEGSGGGVLVFGEILEEDLIYTPLVPTRSHYNVDVEGIAINGQNLPIDPKVFKSSRYRGAIFDSGFTFVSLIDEAYTPFANNIKTALSHLVPVTGLGSDLCYESSTSKVEDFPIITFNFAGHATMNLKPEDYLVEGIAVSNSILYHSPPCFPINYLENRRKTNFVVTGPHSYKMHWYKKDGDQRGHNNRRY
ncbi:Xylanase inhibitor, C-terminal [Dillenia turbinata]|uniref:Xylanase inhibitor, C-terminal n=1 Tax=Dillenia turbinata TaxID=194707 RepID=A0AAN8UYS5_9MAGN